MFLFKIHSTNIITAFFIKLLSIIGDFDLTCVIIAKDTNELEEISMQIRQKYSEIIDDWKSVLVLKSHKLEYYDLT